VEKAIANLRRARALTPGALNRLPEAELAELIRPAGYFNQKARYLKAFMEFLFAEHSGRLDSLFAMDVPEIAPRVARREGNRPRNRGTASSSTQRRNRFSWSMLITRGCCRVTA